MIPGPTNVDPIVLRSMARPRTMQYLNSPETYHFIAKEQGLILPLSGSGTLGAEVALANILEPGDKVLAISGGYFGDRLAEVANTGKDEADLCSGQHGQGQMVSVNFRALHTRLCSRFMWIRPRESQTPQKNLAGSLNSGVYFSFSIRSVRWVEWMFKSTIGESTCASQALRRLSPSRLE